MLWLDVSRGAGCAHSGYSVAYRMVVRAQKGSCALRNAQHAMYSTGRPSDRFSTTCMRKRRRRGRGAGCGGREAGGGEREAGGGGRGTGGGGRGAGRACPCCVPSAPRQTAAPLQGPYPHDGSVDREGAGRARVQALQDCKEGGRDDLDRAERVDWGNGWPALLQHVSTHGAVF